MELDPVRKQKDGEITNPPKRHKYHLFEVTLARANENVTNQVRMQRDGVITNPPKRDGVITNPPKKHKKHLFTDVTLARANEQKCHQPGENAKGRCDHQSSQKSAKII